MKDGEEVHYQPVGEWNGHRLYLKQTPDGRLELHDILVRRYPAPDCSESTFATYLSPIELSQDLTLLNRGSIKE